MVEHFLDQLVAQLVVQVLEVTQLRLLTETSDELVHRLTGFLAHLAERIALEGDVRLGPEVVFEDSGGPDVDVVLVLVFGALETFVLPWPKKTTTTIMHKIRTLFLSRNIGMIRRLAQWRN